MLAFLAMVIRCAAQDGDVHDLQENLPVRVTDAIASQGPQVQARTLVTRSREGSTQIEVEPQLQWGFAPKWHVQVASVMLASTREANTNSGDIQILLFRQINRETGALPMFAVSAGIDAPTGIDSAGLDTRFRGILSKTVSRGPAQHRLHFNGEWLRNAAQRDDERAHAWLATAGYSRLLGRNSVLILDLARAQERAKDDTLTLAEAGFRGRVARQTVLSIGVGVGLGPASPKAQFTFGVEQSF